MSRPIRIRRRCATMGVHHHLCEFYPDFRARQWSLERLTARRLHAARPALPLKPFTIQVVVHVVHRTAADNLAPEQIHGQVEALNRDFRARNSDRSSVPVEWASLITDTWIEFVLAARDPAGARTDGITRTRTTRRDFDADDGVKFASSGGAPAWPRDRYLNLWTCALGNGLLGYAQFPGGPKSTDGVVISNRAFGTTGTARPPFHLGRTATHEVGHWLNLRHIWADTDNCEGTDFVRDTPNSAGPNYGKPRYPHISCGNGPLGDVYLAICPVVLRRQLFDGRLIRYVEPEPKTLGQHLRRRRRELGLTAKEAGALLGVSHIAVFNWERDRFEPHWHHWPGIIGFLGRDPIPVGEGLGDQLRAARRRLGLTRLQLARRLSLHVSLVAGMEEGVRGLGPKSRTRVASLFRAVGLSEGH